MVNRFRGLAAAAAVLISLAGGDAHAASPRFERVSVLSAGDRVSLVFELTAEPQNVATRRVSAAVLELDAGPVTMPAKATSFMAPPGVRYVMGVSIHSAQSAEGDLLKARITLLERVRSAVRVAGNRVYVDFSPEAQDVPQPPGSTPVRPAPRPASTPPAPAAATAAVPPAPGQSAVEAYRAAVQPAVERFEQLQPFLVSATASPSEPVLKAIGSTLVGIQGLLLSVDVPGELRATHDVLSSAIAAASNAVDPAFEGDRAARARQAISLFKQASSN